jgi:hypothetical protein
MASITRQFLIEQLLVKTRDTSHIYQSPRRHTRSKKAEGARLKAEVNSHRAHRVHGGTGFPPSRE